MSDFPNHLPAGLTDELGSPDWWARLAAKGTPWVETLSSDSAQVWFFWRDPEGGPERSSTRTVLIDVNAVTDHHSVTPATMQRLGLSDVWCWSTELPLDWRGSYVFAPQSDPLEVPDYQGNDHEKRLQHRHWWLGKITSTGQPDPLSPWPSHGSSWGIEHSALHLPKALPQPHWQSLDSGQSPSRHPIIERQWHSPSLNNERSIWSYRTGELNDLPLVILLDGQHWHRNLPIYSALDSATKAGDIPPAQYLLIDSINLEQRQIDLSCSDAFWLALQTELLPMLQAELPFTAQPEKTLVCGQSLGGLSALYANLRWPLRFGAALAQSASLWWPDRSLVAPDFGKPRHRLTDAIGWLTEQTQLAPSNGRIFMEVGTGEASMVDLHDNHVAVLQQHNYQVTQRHYAGGHDWLCWRGGLIDGLSVLLKP